MSVSMTDSELQEDWVTVTISAQKGVWPDKEMTARCAAGAHSPSGGLRSFEPIEGTGRKGSPCWSPHASTTSSAQYSLHAGGEGWVGRGKNDTLVRKHLAPTQKPWASAPAPAGSTAWPLLPAPKAPSTHPFLEPGKQVAASPLRLPPSCSGVPASLDRPWGPSLCVCESLLCLLRGLRCSFSLWPPAH